MNILVGSKQWNYQFDLFSCILTPLFHPTKKMNVRDRNQYFLSDTMQGTFNNSILFYPITLCLLQSLKLKFIRGPHN